MNLFEQIKSNISRVAKELPGYIVGIMVDNGDQIIDINLKQLKEGQGADGAILGEYASPEYAQLKQALGSQAPLGVADAYFEGDFYNGFYHEPYFGSDIDSSGLLIDSRDEKTESLERKYPDIFGIAPDNVPDVQELLIDDINNKLADEITII